MEALSRVSWLFVRGSETIRLSYAAEAQAISANGPGRNSRVFKFGDEDTAAEFLKLYEHFLASGGWALQAFVERRSEQGPGAPPDNRERRRRPPA